MKLLFISTQFPYPLDNGGKIGAYNGLNVVSGMCDVTCLSFSEEPDTINEGLLHYAKILPKVKFEPPIIHDIHIRKKPFKLLKVMVNNYYKNLPYVTAKFENKAMYESIDKMFNSSFWDIVFIDYLNMNIYADYIIKNYNSLYGCMILKDHNIEYEIVKQAYETSRFPIKLILNNEWKRTFYYEQRAIKQADIVFSVCNSNTKFMKHYNNNSYTMLPTYEIKSKNNNEKSIVNNQTKKNNILYTGNLSWRANMEGLKWFVKKVFPLIKDKIQDVKLTIIGSGPATNPFIGMNDIDYKGYIKDISNIYLEHKVFIVPLFEGSGIRIKILEAFNNELAVVSTTLGCESINAKNKKELFIADNEKEFSDYVIKLLIDDTCNIEMVSCAKKFLQQNFSLDSHQKEFERIVQEYLSKKSKSNASSC